MFHKEKAKQCANLLNEACLARMGGWEDQQQKEPFYKERSIVVYFIFALIVEVGRRGER